VSWSRPRRQQWVLLAAAVVTIAGRARAAGEEGAVIRLRVAGSPAEARATRAVLAELLSRVGIGIADDGSALTAPPLADVEIDLSTGHGGPFVLLATGQPPAIICRRPLSPQASREVLIESAAEVAYAAVESRERAVDVVRADAVAPAPAGRTGEQPPAAPPDRAAVGTVIADAAPLRAQASPVAALPWYGVDAAAFAEMQLRNLGAGLPATGGGAAVTFGLRGIRLDPALVLALSYLRSVGLADPAAPRELSVVSTRLGVTVDAVRLGRIALQVGPSLAADVVRGEAPQFTPGGPPPASMMQPTGETTSFSRLAIWAGGSTRLSLQIARGSYLFVAAGADYELRQPASPRPAVFGGPPNGASGAPSGNDGGPSGWRSSFLVGLAFTLAGRPLMTD
jgi:hypothetical protein